MHDLTRLLRDSSQPGASEELARVLYEELRAIAGRELQGERSDHTLQPTALAHEAWLRLFPSHAQTFQTRLEFFAAAATAIRRVLIEHARRRSAQKRGCARSNVSIDEIEVPTVVRDEDLIEIDQALDELSAFAVEPARVVELRFFAGLGMDEIAQAMGVSLSTIERHWRLARAWLRDHLDDPREPDDT